MASTGHQSSSTSDSPQKHILEITEKVPRLICVHHPGHVINPAKAIETLGGKEGLNKMKTAKIVPLNFRPKFKMSHPILGEASDSANILIKVRRKKRKPKSVAGSAYGTDTATTTVHAEIVGRVVRRVDFRRLSDFQVCPSVPNTPSTLQQIDSSHYIKFDSTGSNLRAHHVVCFPRRRRLPAATTPSMRHSSSNGKTGAEGGETRTGRWGTEEFLSTLIADIERMLKVKDSSLRNRFRAWYDRLPAEADEEEEDVKAIKSSSSSRLSSSSLSSDSAMVNRVGAHPTAAEEAVYINIMPLEAKSSTCKSGSSIISHNSTIPINSQGVTVLPPPVSSADAVARMSPLALALKITRMMTLRQQENAAGVAAAADVYLPTSRSLLDFDRVHVLKKQPTTTVESGNRATKTMAERKKIRKIKRKRTTIKNNNKSQKNGNASKKSSSNATIDDNDDNDDTVAMVVEEEEDDDDEEEKEEEEREGRGEESQAP